MNMHTQNTTSETTQAPVASPNAEQRHPAVPPKELAVDENSRNDAAAAESWWLRCQILTSGLIKKTYSSYGFIRNFWNVT